MPQSHMIGWTLLPLENYYLIDIFDGGILGCPAYVTLDQTLFHLRTLDQQIKSSILRTSQADSAVAAASRSKCHHFHYVSDGYYYCYCCFDQVLYLQQTTTLLPFHI